MQPIVLQPAVKVVKPMKVLSYGPTHSGKTYSSIELAVGIVMAIRKCTKQEAYKHIVLIDSEYGRGALYSKLLGPYNYLKIDAPYHTEKVVNIINQLNMMDQVDVIIFDSLTHFWVKEGGVLDQKAAKDKQGGNSYTNWQEFTAKFNKMIDAILGSPKHILCTARAKSDTALVDVNGKAVPKTFGLKTELRDGIEYDFDIVFNIDKSSHNLIVDKGVPGMEPVYELGTAEIGMSLYDVFNADAVIVEATEAEIADRIRNIAKSNNMITQVQLALNGRKLDELTREDLLKLEADLLNELKKRQVKNATDKK